jgi:hypothetical protein
MLLDYAVFNELCEKFVNDPESLNAEIDAFRNGILTLGNQLPTAIEVMAEQPTATDVKELRIAMSIAMATGFALGIQYIQAKLTRNYFTNFFDEKK